MQNRYIPLRFQTRDVKGILVVVHMVYYAIATIYRKIIVSHC